MRVKVAVYTPLGLDSYELCHPVSKDDLEAINVAINRKPREAHALILRQSAVESMVAVMGTNIHGFENVAMKQYLARGN